MRKVIALVGSTVLGVSCLALTATPASAKTYTACVKKKSGEVRMVKATKKCKKGWKKVTWTKAAPRGESGTPGAAGPATTFGDVFDGSGARIGQQVGFALLGAFAYFIVRTPDGNWPYLSNGWLYSLGTAIAYDNAACTGSPFLPADDAEEAAWLQADRPTGRYIERATAPLGPAKAFKQTGTSTNVVALPVWFRGSNGDCQPGANVTGVRIDLQEVPAPPDRPGPLTLRPA